MTITTTSSSYTTGSPALDPWCLEESRPWTWMLFEERMVSDHSLSGRQRRQSTTDLVSTPTKKESFNLERPSSRLLHLLLQSGYYSQYRRIRCSIHIPNYPFSL